MSKILDFVRGGADRQQPQSNPQQADPGAAVNQFTAQYGCRPSEYLHGLVSSGRIPKAQYDQMIPQARAQVSRFFRF